MRSIILGLAFAPFAASGLTTASAAPPWTGASPPGARCANELAHLARPGKGALHRKLTDLPPADAFLAVYTRDADRCNVPVKVNFRNQPPDRRSPRRR